MTTELHDPIIDTPESLDLYELMLRIRMFEKRAGQMFSNSEIPGFIHLSLGQEAIAAGVVGALEAQDYITATHRGHGHVIAKGAKLGPMMAELMARTTGYCRGKGGSMHIFSHELGVLGANAILGAGQPIAVGAAMGARLRGSDAVAATFFGEGASAQGAVHEAMNLAAIWHAPVLFVAEVNGFAELTPYSVHVPIPSLAARGAAYGIRSESVDGLHVEDVRAATRASLARIRAGGGPELLEVRAVRWGGHFEGDQQRYRDPEDLDQARSSDPIATHHSLLESRGTADDWFAVTEARLMSELEEAVEFARSSPPVTANSLFDDVYAGGSHG